MASAHPFAGKTHADPVVFDLASLASTTCDQLRLVAEDKGVRLTCSFSLAHILGDPARVKLVLVNLIDNAISFTPVGKGIDDVSVAASQSHALLEVRDQGFRVSAFPPWPRRASSIAFIAATKPARELGGSGLDLAIVQAICRAHNATVDVQSIEGDGARFCIKFPLAPPEHERMMNGSLIFPPL